MAKVPNRGAASLRTEAARWTDTATAGGEESKMAAVGRRHRRRNSRLASSLWKLITKKIAYLTECFASDESLTRCSVPARASGDEIIRVRSVSRPRPRRAAILASPRESVPRREHDELARGLPSAPEKDFGKLARDDPSADAIVQNVPLRRRRTPAKLQIETGQDERSR